ncbi:MAG: hypothetical protein CVU16_14690 [Betaproteobacteria bacterium HGW-Betaproteobacteria-10]|nr:MAG: hypothetical protein CVU16_14690 [Betaproteobacteria bacterium HGW-Betaproteobacteria-10]
MSNDYQTSRGKIIIFQSITDFALMKILCRKYVVRWPPAIDYKSVQGFTESENDSSASRFIVL